MGTSVYAIRISRLFYCALSVTKSKCTSTTVRVKFVRLLFTNWSVSYF